MKIHSDQKIGELKKLRQQGYSIGELVRKLSIPKTTVWHHVHDVDVLPEYVQILRSKIGGNTERYNKRWEQARDRAYFLLNGVNRDLIIALAMLYWSEGSKKVCDFINSDGRMIKLYLFIIRNVLEIPEELIKPTMRIFTGMNEPESLNYWSNITQIAPEKFIVRLNDGGTSGKTKYGMCRITIRKGNKILKLFLAMIDEFLKEKVRI